MFEIVRDRFRQHPDKEIKIPKRATKHSAGYDISTPVKVVIPPHSVSETVLTDICVNLWDVDWVDSPKKCYLQIVPRSSVGFKKNIMLVNTVGIIDQDFYLNPKNGGNIGFAFYNYSDKEVIIEEGENVLQGIISTYGTFWDEEEPTSERVGGIGSTNEN